MVFADFRPVGDSCSGGQSARPGKRTEQPSSTQCYPRSAVPGPNDRQGIETNVRRSVSSPYPTTYVPGPNDRQGIETSRRRSCVGLSSVSGPNDRQGIETGGRQDERNYGGKRSRDRMTEIGRASC